LNGAAFIFQFVYIEFVTTSFSIHILGARAFLSLYIDTS
jgi:hypothetical protein